MLVIDHGTIDQMSENDFKWNIPDVIQLIKVKPYIIGSPIFIFQKDGFILTFRRAKNDTGVFVTRFSLHRSLQIGCSPSTQSYKLCVKDVEGEIYWTSPILIDEFKAFSGFNGNPQDIRESSLVRHSTRITTEGVLAVYLTFYPLGRRPSRQVVNPSAGSTSTAYFGTQTCRALNRKQDLPSDSDDADELSQNFADLLQTGEFSDVTFNVKGTEIKVHKSILVARSPVFRDMFEFKVKQSTGIVEITDCDADLFQDLLLYLYSGKVETFTVKNVVELYRIAYKYDVKPLLAKCIHFMIQNLTLDSFQNFVSLTLRYYEPELLASASKFLGENLRQIVDTPQWKNFNAKNPSEASELLVTALSQVKKFPNNQLP